MTETTSETPSQPPTAGQPSPIHRIFTATLILGVPGSGKTTLFKGFAEYLWETYRKVLLLYSTDGGAIPTDVQKRMKQGLIRFWRMRTRSAPGLGLETMYLASRGYWPRQINPETGETSPAVTLVPPVTTSYRVTCPQGHPLSVVPSPSMVVPMMCTPCGSKFIAMPDLRVTETAVRTKGFELVGGVGFDGLTSFTDGVLDHMDLQRGEGNIGGEKAAFGGVVKSGALSFGGNNRADVGFGQSRGHQFVNNSLSIPHLVEGPVWTALAMEATDEGGLPIVGPKLPGRAATDEASAWFGNVAETGKSPDESGKSCFTLWLRPFTDQQNRRHLLKTSASPTGVPDLLRDPSSEAGQPYSVVNLGKVFQMLDEDLRRGLQEELPGAPVTPGEYGEALTVQQQAPATAPQMPASGIAPLVAPSLPAVAAAQQPAAVATTIAAIPNVAGAAAPPAGSMPMMVAKPRAKKGAGTMAATTPIGPPAAAAAPVPESQTAPPVVAPVTAAPVLSTPVTVAPSGTTPPPPPGMRPPMKAPGA